MAWRCLTPGIFPTLDGDLDLADFTPTEEVVPRDKILANGIGNIRDRLVFGGALRPAPRQTGRGDAEAFLVAA